VPTVRLRASGSRVASSHAENTAQKIAGSAVVRPRSSWYVAVLGRREPGRDASENSTPTGVTRWKALYSEARDVNTVTLGTRLRRKNDGWRSVAPR
jgi:hypothetical protein